MRLRNRNFKDQIYQRFSTWGTVCKKNVICLGGTIFDFGVHQGVPEGSKYCIGVREGRHSCFGGTRVLKG
jgi:hypothetical protein